MNFLISVFWIFLFNGFTPIEENKNNPAIIVTVGAGDVYKIVDTIGE